MRLSVAWATGLAGLLCTLHGLPEARAAGNGGIALDQFEPAPAGDSFFGVPSPFARGPVTPRIIAMFDYADQPLKVTQEAAAGGPGAVVGRQAFLHLNASLAVQDRLLISALLPIALLQNGDSPRVMGARLASPTSAQVGDLRVGLRVRMLGDDEDPFQLAVGFNLHIPTAPAGSLAGEGTFREQPQLLAGGRFKIGVPFVWSANGGVLIRASDNPSMITYGAGLAASLFNERILFGPEFYAATPIQHGSFMLSGSTATIPANTTTNAELLVGAHIRVYRGLMVGWAAGPGLTRAVGTPDIRFVGSIGWAPGLPVKVEAQADSDGDGVPDLIDACPYAAGPANVDRRRSGCPVVDDDEDGIPNADDACPDKYGVKSANPKLNGCPPRK